METLEFLALIWSKYFDGQISINKVVKAYDDYDFDANQDVPGNVCWEELYNASPKEGCIPKGFLYSRVRIFYRMNLMVLPRNCENFFMVRITEVQKFWIVFDLLFHMRKKMVLRPCKRSYHPGTKLADPGLRETDYIIHINTTILPSIGRITVNLILVHTK